MIPTPVAPAASRRFCAAHSVSQAVVEITDARVVFLPDRFSCTESLRASKTAGIGLQPVLFCIATWSQKRRLAACATMRGLLNDLQLLAYSLQNLERRFEFGPLVRCRDDSAQTRFAFRDRRVTNSRGK